MNPCHVFSSDVTHRQLPSIDQVWRRSTALTWSRWGCRRLADNIWLLAHDNNNNQISTVDPHEGLDTHRSSSLGHMPSVTGLVNHTGDSRSQRCIYRVRLHPLNHQATDGPQCCHCTREKLHTLALFTTYCMPSKHTILFLARWSAKHKDRRRAEVTCRNKTLLLTVRGRFRRRGEW